MDLELKVSQIPVVPAEGEQQQARPKRLNFSNPNERAEHIHAFLTWLPQELHDAPEIAWDCLPSRVMGYLIRNVTGHPDAIPITFAIGCAMGGIKNYTLLKYCGQLVRLLRQLRSQYGMRSFAQLKERWLWDSFVTGRTLTSSEMLTLTVYDGLASLHIRSHLEALPERQRMFWETYVLPPLPAGFQERHGFRQAAEAATKERRKEQSDVLTPLFPLLVELAQLRKQATERLVKEFRKQRDRAIAGEITLPYHFSFTDRSFSVTEDAPSIASVGLVERTITLSFTLWDRVQWVKHHTKHYKGKLRRQVERQVGPYAPERTLYFLQYHGEPQDLLWCGDILANRRLAYVRSRSEGFVVSRPGLLSPDKKESHWLAQHSKRVQEGCLLEPESLYRGVLYASALATLALTNGSRVSELLQASAIRFETLVVDELKNQQPTGRKIGILVQNLLPKGSRQESERQFFLIGDMAARLLREIGQLLQVAHGGSIPIVHPSTISKEEDLHPEPYLFQWAASGDGRIGLLADSDVGVLLRFLFHGLTLTTRTGKPIRVATHLLRHVMATYTRTVKNVPAEAVAFLLHHRVMLPDGMRAISVPEATAYYSRLPLERLLALLFEAQSTLTLQSGRSYLQAPTPRTLEEMDAALRQIFEQWGLIGPTVLGFCSAGLCVRPDNRALCLNCQYLVPHYSHLRNAKTWRKLYMLQAQLHDDHGHAVDAKQARQMVHYLDDVIRIMEIQIRTRQDGGYLPFADTLPEVSGEGEENQ